jgi:hypothetical protein
MLKYWIMGGTASALLTIAPLASQAAPLGNAGDIRATGQETSAVETVAARRCWWRNGERHCSRARYVRPHGYGYYPSYGRPRPEEFRTGSTAWWRSMDEEGRGGHGRNP